MLRNGLLSICTALLCVFSVGSAASLPAWGQASNTGTVVGSVVDSSRAAVPGAQVILTQTMTGAERTTTTDDTGRFAFADVDPNVYDIKITKPGFATTVITSQVVSVGTQLTENVTLNLGVLSTTITVADTPGAELQTLAPTVGTTLSGDIILNLPNTSRDASSLAVLEPGQNIIGNVGGVATDQNSFQLDGGYATDDMSGDNNSYVASFASDTAGGIGNYHSSQSSGQNQLPSAVVPVPVASIEEFKISTANQTADFNGGAGSQMQLVTKRGTNALHGSVYEYYEDSNFAGANTWDNNSTGTAQPSAHFSRFGADAGGKIPHSNFLGGSWYMFGLYEGFRYPLNSEFEQTFPLPSLRAGIIHLDGQTVNLNPFPVLDPGCGTTTTGCLVTAANGYTPGATIQTTACPGGPCDPRGLGTTMNGSPTGTPNPVITLWNTYLPLPNDCTQGDGLNYCGYKGAISKPQSSNFGVARIDHDFATKWHFNGTYHYFKLANTDAGQWDVGGFFPGDVKGQYSAIRHKPQLPWIYTAGLTTNLTPSVTNDFHFSFTRNWWAFTAPGDVPNVAGYPATLSVGFGFEPYITGRECCRSRYWNGHDYMYRDDVSWLKGNHLFQLGGSYRRNNDTHTRNDSGSGITFEQYIIGGGAPLISYNIDMTPYIPTGITAGDSQTYQNLYSIILGMVDETKTVYTRGVGSLTTGLPLEPRTSCAISGVAATADCISSPSLTDDSIIPTYNLYFSDSWHIKPSFSLNYGLGYTVEMPPYSINGGYQSVMVDQNDHILSGEQYLHNIQQAALQGNAYAPLIGFATVHNAVGNPNYPYNSFYGGLSPRVGFAWNFLPDTVIRGGYARIFGRINGDLPVLLPMLTPGLMQTATCLGPEAPLIVGNSTTCGGTPANVFRVGVDCPDGGPCIAPLPPPSAYLPQPWYPGFNDVDTGGGGGTDPNFKPNRSDEFTLSIQHQFGPRIMAEAGYIGRILSNELQFYSLTPVPYMMTKGGQTFANAWKNVMVATNYGTNLSSIPTQPFFESALNPEYCAGFANCTVAFVTNNAVQGLMQLSDPFDAWASISNAGMFNFGRTMTSDPIAATCSTINPAATTTIGCNGQSPDIIATTSNGFGNYNAGYLQLTFQDWHGLTMKTSLNYGHALGTQALIQASTAAESVDPFNLRNSYGPQYYDEKFTFNLFLNYAPPFYASQNDLMGRLLGGWNFSPLFVYGTGFPVLIGTAIGCSFGECNTADPSAFENMVITQNLHYSATEKKATGTICGTIGPGYNVFSNPDATCPVNGGIFGDPVRNPILGLDGDIGGGGPVRGLPFWNLDLGVTKKIKYNDKLSSALYFDFDNVLNHMQAADPCFSASSPAYWGVLGCGGNLQANTPRRLQLALSVNW
jgi:Carboxypeptidase regulatory-like domain/TonB dependent receptor